MYRFSHRIFHRDFSAKFLGLPPACGPLLQLATAQAGQGNSQNKRWRILTNNGMGNSVDTPSCYKVACHISQVRWTRHRLRRSRKVKAADRKRIRTSPRSRRSRASSAVGSAGHIAFEDHWLNELRDENGLWLCNEPWGDLQMSSRTQEEVEADRRGVHQVAARREHEKEELVS